MSRILPILLGKTLYIPEGEYDAMRILSGLLPFYDKPKDKPMPTTWKQRKHKSRTHAQQTKKDRGRGLNIALADTKSQSNQRDKGYNALYALLSRAPLPNCTKSKVDRKGNPK